MNKFDYTYKIDDNYIYIKVAMQENEHPNLLMIEKYINHTFLNSCLNSKTNPKLSSCWGLHLYFPSVIK